MNNNRKNMVSIALLTLVLAAGCGESPRQTSTSADRHGHDHGAGGAHSHGDHPRMPHGGTPVQVGDHGFHLELVHDSTEGQMLAYVLDAHMEKAVSVPATSFELVATAEGTEHRLTFTAVTNAPGSTAEKTSLFSAPAGELAEIREFKGTIPEITLNGRTFRNVTFNYPEGTFHEH